MVALTVNAILSIYDRSALALQLEPLYQAEAKRRQQSTQFGNTVPQNSAEPEKHGETRDKLAALAGVSHDTLRKVKASRRVENSHANEKPATANRPRRAFIPTR